MAKCKNCRHFYKKPDITMFTCVESKPHEDNTVIDCDNYAPITNADRIRSMTDEELAEVLFGSCIEHMGVEECSHPEEACKSCVLDWLKAESEE